MLTPVKRLLLVTLLVLSGGPVYAEWALVSDNDRGDMTAYANPDTIRRKGEMVTMWILFDFKTTQTTHDNQSYLSLKGKDQYDCDGERVRSLIVTDFSDHMGNGKAVLDAPFEGKWRPVQQATIDHALWKVACGKQ